jgi:hypothetical protein
MAQDLRAVLRSEAWTGLQSRSEQVVFRHNFSETECGKLLPNQVLGYIFEIQESHVRKICSEAKTKARTPHRPLALNSEKENAAIEFIEAGHSKGNFVTQRSMLNFVEANFGKCLTYGWVATLLVRPADRICRAFVSPQEKPPLEISRTFLDRYLALVKEYVPLVPTELKFNINESGFSDWEEREHKGVLIPIRLPESTLHYPVNRSIRHQSLICCISAAGEAYCPLLASSNPAVKRVFDEGIREGTDLRIEIGPSAYMNSEIFERYCDTVLIPVTGLSRNLGI